MLLWELEYVYKADAYLHLCSIFKGAKQSSHYYHNYKGFWSYINDRKFYEVRKKLILSLYSYPESEHLQSLKFDAWNQNPSLLSKHINNLHALITVNDQCWRWSKVAGISISTWTNPAHEKGLGICSPPACLPARGSPEPVHGLHKLQSQAGDAFCIVKDGDGLDIHLVSFLEIQVFLHSPYILGCYSVPLVSVRLPRQFSRGARCGHRLLPAHTVTSPHLSHPGTCLISNCMTQWERFSCLNSGYLMLCYGLCCPVSICPFRSIEYHTDFCLMLTSRMLQGIYSDIVFRQLNLTWGWELSQRFGHLK